MRIEYVSDDIGSSLVDLKIVVYVGRFGSEVTIRSNRDNLEGSGATFTEAFDCLVEEFKYKFTKEP